MAATTWALLWPSARKIQFYARVKNVKLLLYLWAPFRYRIPDARPAGFCRTILRQQFAVCRTRPWDEPTRVDEIISVSMLSVGNMKLDRFLHPLKRKDIIVLTSRLRTLYDELWKHKVWKQAILCPLHVIHKSPIAHLFQLKLAYLVRIQTRTLRAWQRWSTSGRWRRAGMTRWRHDSHTEFRLLPRVFLNFKLWHNKKFVPLQLFLFYFSLLSVFNVFFSADFCISILRNEHPYFHAFTAMYAVIME